MKENAQVSTKDLYVGELGIQDVSSISGYYKIKRYIESRYTVLKKRGGTYRDVFTNTNYKMGNTFHVVKDGDVVCFNLIPVITTCEKVSYNDLKKLLLDINKNAIIIEKENNEKSSFFARIRK